MNRRAGIAIVLVFLAALLGVGVAAAASADEGAVTVTVSVPSTSPSPPPEGSTGDLPRTGQPIALILGVAATLIVVGAGLVALSRRSRNSPHHPPAAAVRPGRKEQPL
ncbi:LPXTG cell wall anchor domain-containing protein [Dactylosporangium siamense]|uniref:Gram-positive cocci surface proteins LPxTG domain-containing protein n=1 Tax=Dactylosporangium siamense TaxID=685454 RepID=A0A919PWN9_9ACTN|nr:LPXTG cell wall anchor domain-containing protein [Dactylosporangium siamense]GIG52155.1 hypothetical protein Dsi01nite_101960 [Dactylosporangium siamense]